VTGHLSARHLRFVIVAITLAAGAALGFSMDSAAATAVSVDEPVQIGDAMAIERAEPRPTDGVAVAGVTMVRPDPIAADRAATTLVYDETEVFPRVVIVLCAFSLIAALFWSRARASERRAASGGGLDDTDAGFGVALRTDRLG
jgi:hypothetical protein